jgi:hypothetical protein
MWLDAEELRVEDGLDLSELASAIELVMIHTNRKTPEAKWLSDNLEYMRDECERHMPKKWKH